MTNRNQREGGAAKGKIIPFPGKRPIPGENVTRQEDITVSGLAALMVARQGSESDNNAGIKTTEDHAIRRPDGTAVA